ncbi:hypothetical protein [Clostridium gasigenes]|nr:hypothetical protein [Clostridium gasigenes]
MVANNTFIIKEMEGNAEDRVEKKGKLEVARNLLDILDYETIATKIG